MGYIPNPNIRLILNGGQRTLDTATVPVEWHFSDELIVKIPQFIVICDHADSLSDFADNLHYRYGTRHLCRVRDLVSYVQLRRAGKHHFVALVFYGEEKDAMNRARIYMKKEGTVYDVSLFVSSVLQNNADEFINKCETTVVEFEVPPQLFSERPKTKIGQAVWTWANRWYNTDPVDQCDYRRRRITAFTVQPPLFVVGRLFAGIFGTLYTIIGSALLFFIGWRPNPVIESVINAWVWPSKFEFDLKKYERWRLWRDYDSSKDYNLRCIPVYQVPFFILSLVVSAVFVIHMLVLLVMNYGFQFLIYFGGCLLLALVVVIIIKYLKRPDVVAKKNKLDAARLNRIRADKRTKAQVQNEAFAKFLQENTKLSLAPAKVNIGAVIKKVNPVTKFVLGYWATKAMVCKPFAK